MMKSIFKNTWILTLFFIVVLSSCSKTVENVRDKEPPKHVYDLPEIKKKNRLRALIDYSSTSYFIYKGRPMGYEYELLERFANHIGVELAVIPVKNMDQIVDLLTSFQGDVIATNLTITQNRAEVVEFSTPILETKQVLIQRKGEEMVKSPFDLKGKKIYVRRHSSFYDRLMNLSSEIGGKLDIQTVSGDVTIEELMQRVSDGEIDYTVSDGHVAKINSSFYSNLDFSVELSLSQQIAWAVRKESPELKVALDTWLESFKKTVDFRVIYLKYFGNTSLFTERVRSKYYTGKSGKISDYDKILQKEADKIEWDWRLLASLIYQESGFDHSVESWMGARGLMQLMPSTAAEFGLDSASSPEMNIRAGVKYLSWLDKQFEKKVPVKEERKKFVLAAYNVGLGHVYDAIRLAKKYNKDPMVWNENVDLMLLNKMKPRYYQDEVVKYGYCRGSEPYAYVRNIYSRYDNYKYALEM